MSGLRRVIVGASGSPGNLCALRYAEHLARATGATLIPVHAWIPPGGDVADRRCPVSTCAAERGEPGAVLTFRRGLTACDSEWLLACTAHNHHPRSVPDPPLPGLCATG